MKKVCLLILIIFACSSCKWGKRNDPVIQLISSGKSPLTITQKQLDKAGYKFGKIQKTTWDIPVCCSGIIEGKPSSTAIIQSQCEGAIDKINFCQGQYVKKGQVLFVIKSNEGVDLAKDFLEISSQYDFSKYEFKREGEKALDDAGTVKEAQVAEVDYKSMEARYYALKVKLTDFGINTNKLNPENISNKTYIKAPISGYISDINAAIGERINTTRQLCKIIDLTKARAVFKVNERYFPYIIAGQELTVLGMDSILYNVDVISRKIDTSSHTFNIYTNLDERFGSLALLMSIKSKLIVNKVPLLYLPSTAIFNICGKKYVIVFKHNKITKYIVNTGVIKDGMIEIAHPSQQLFSDSIVLKSI
jgi:membrane fusion protein, heavy metal efflux system